MPSSDETHASDFSEVHVIDIDSDHDIDTPVIKIEQQDNTMNGN
ncbi:jg27197, partial [Pararge aegeria aegeria]